MVAPNLTAEDFAAQRFDLPEGGRWTELLCGEILNLEPPSPEHGTVVLNFSKALADHLQGFPEGYACFELGLIVGRQPDSVYCPAISYFTGGKLFAELDNTITETKPALIVEVASTIDRRRTIRRRTQEYLKWGVPVVIVVEPRDKLIAVHLPNRTTEVLSSGSFIESNDLWATSSQSILQRFSVSVDDLFHEPEWTRRGK
jgi:Uma2 family endonuclease